MSNIAIKVDNLSKAYRLGQIGTGTITNDLKVWWAKTRGKPNPLLKIGEKNLGNSDGETIWALKNINFTVEQGEALGIIGRNGAGKSTLLKILSRVTAPTSGRISVKGRIASLLEVGTGFHPDLTGRENIFLNGAILGMSRKEVQRKFEEIVSFSEIEQFIDTPVKRYSSGMYVRLAFAVAAHLDPEILVVDEVLAVGDVAFQKKCLNKMHDIGQGGRTVLFVSHNLATVTRLCGRSILVQAGSIVADGLSEEVIGQYLKTDLGASASVEWQMLEDAPGNDNVRLRSVRIINSKLQTAETIDVREPVGIEIEFKILKQKEKFVPWIALYNDRQVHAFSAFDTDPAWRVPRPIGLYNCIVWIPGNLLNEGTHVLSLTLSTFTSGGKSIRQADAKEILAFQVVDPGFGDTARGDYGAIWTAPVRPLLKWETSFTPI